MHGTNGAARRRRTPSDVEAERALIACVLLDPSKVDALTDLPDGAFFEPQTYAISCAVRSLSQRGEPVDVASLRHELQGAAEFRETSVATYAAGLFEQTPTAANAAYFAGRIRDANRQRNAVRMLETALEHLGDAGDDLAAVLTRTRNDLDAVLAGDSATASRFNALSVEAFIDAVRPREYLIDRVLVQGESCFLTGEEKSFKTSVLIDLAVSLASGGCFLGKFPVSRPQRVYVMTGETGGPGIKELVLAICDAARLHVSELAGRLFLTEELPRLEDDSHLADLTRELVRTEADVLVAEPIYRMVNGEIMPNFVLFSEMLERAQSAAKAAWRRLGRDGSPTVIFAHHHNSNGRSAYGGGLQWRRQWIELSHRLPFDSNVGQAFLKMTTGGSAGHSGCWGVDIFRGQPRPPEYRRVWQITGFGPIEDVEDKQRREAEDERVQEAMQKILAFLEGSDGETKRGIRDGSGLRTNEASEAIDRLMSDGSIEACTVKKHTRTEDGFRLAKVVVGNGGT